MNKEHELQCSFFIDSINFKIILTKRKSIGFIFS